MTDTGQLYFSEISFYYFSSLLDRNHHASWLMEKQIQRSWSSWPKTGLLSSLVHIPNSACPKPSLTTSDFHSLIFSHILPGQSLLCQAFSGLLKDESHNYTELHYCPRTRLNHQALSVLQDIKIYLTPCKFVNLLFVIVMMRCCVQFSFDIMVGDCTHECWDG